MLQKSSWKDFMNEGKLGLAYCGSGYDKNIKSLVEGWNTDDNLSLYVDRLLVGGSSVLQFRTDRETISRLDKVGKVWIDTKNNVFYIVDGNTTVVYAIPIDRNLRLVS